MELLEAGPLERFGGFDLPEARSDPLTVEAHALFGDEPPERWAVKILSEFYTAFGYEEDRIPYTTETGIGRVIEPDQIRSVRWCSAV